MVNSLVWNSTAKPSTPFPDWEVVEHHTYGKVKLKESRVELYFPPESKEVPSEGTGDSNVLTISWKGLMSGLEGRQLAANASFLDLLLLDRSLIGKLRLLWHCRGNVSRFLRYRTRIREILNLLKPSNGKARIILFLGTLYRRRIGDELGKTDFFQGLLFSKEHPDGDRSWGAAEDPYYSEDNKFDQPVLVIYPSN